VDWMSEFVTKFETFEVQDIQITKENAMKVLIS